MLAGWEGVRERAITVRKGWESFQQGMVPDDLVRPHILQSWHRSLTAAVGTRQFSAPANWTSAELAQALSRNRLLVEAASAALGGLRTSLAQTDHVVALCDANARALTVEGDTAACRAAERINLVPGSDWSEGAAGTNAMGTAAHEGVRVDIFAAEHYREDLHQWACVAAPIRHPVTGQLLGVLDLTGRSMRVDVYTEIAVESAVQAVQNQLALREARLREALLSVFSTALSRGRQQPLGVIDRYGILLQATGPDLETFQRLPNWEQAVQQVCARSEEHREEWVDAAGQQVRLMFRPIQVDGTVAGALVEPVRTGSRSVSVSKPAGPGLVGGNPGWLSAVDRALKTARTDSTILISGETGTGKEVLARAIHRSSSRSAGPFVAVNCGALPPSLAVSELCGYAGGAFTGANPKGSAGKVEAAEGGTLFLDEVGELAPEAQVALLRVLQEREVVRVGTHQPVKVNVRVVAATNRDLREMVEAGTFRQDLFFRLNVVPVALPPLRERRDDIIPLLLYAYGQLGAEPPALPPSSYDRLISFHWPGNVRELMNLAEQAVALQEDPASLLPLPPLASPTGRLDPDDGEAEQIRQTLAQCGGNAAATARALGVSRTTLYRKLELYGIRLKRAVQ